MFFFSQLELHIGHFLSRQCSTVHVSSLDGNSVQTYLAAPLRQGTPKVCCNSFISLCALIWNKRIYSVFIECEQLCVCLVMQLEFLSEIQWDSSF